MSTEQLSERRVPGDPPAPIRLKLAGFWIAVMFLYIYVDIIGFFKPGVIEDILVGRVWEFDISQSWAVAALVLLAIPSLMVPVTFSLRAVRARVVNIVVAGLYVPVTIFNVVGETWAVYYWLPAIVETILLIAVMRVAWAWQVRAQQRVETTMAPSIKP
jgi:hypothetical protein